MLVVVLLLLLLLFACMVCNVIVVYTLECGMSTNHELGCY